MRIIITGGHLTPALAVIEELNQESRRRPASQRGERGSPLAAGIRPRPETRPEGNQESVILFIGRKYPLEGDAAVSPEYQIITKMRIPFVSLITGRLQRRFTRYTLPSLLKIPLGFFQALWWVGKFRPDLILSFGGYVALPVVVAGWLFRVPIITHEQTVVFGLTNRIVRLLAQKICLSWPKSLKFFPKEKVVFTGNPIRREIFKINKNFQFSLFQRKFAQSKLFNFQLPIIYITGGSLGSHTINEAVSQVLPQLLEKYVVIHQCGDSQKYRDFEKLKAQSAKIKTDRQLRYFLTKYVEPEDIGWVLNKADLVVSRAGANTVAELAALGKVAILIPLPWGGGGEQERNAQMLIQAGTAISLPQEKLSGQTLLTAIKTVREFFSSYQKNAGRAKKLVDLTAASKIVGVLYDLLAEKRKF